MKKYVVSIIACVLLLTLLLGCDSRELDTMKQSGDAAEATELQESTSGGEPQDVPVQIRFQTVNDLSKFFSTDSVCEEDSSTENNITSIFQYETQSKADKIVASVAGIYVPTENNRINAKYFPNNQSMDIIYVIDGIQYCFIYFFDREDDWDYGEIPAFSDVQVGPYTMDFFQLEKPYSEGEYYLLSHIPVSGIDLLVRVQGEQYEEFSFEAFDFVPLSSVGGDVVE